MKTIKPFNTAEFCYLSNNNVLTALEFMFPNVIKSYTKGNQTMHFGIWKNLSVYVETEFMRRGFGGESVLNIIRKFESSFKIQRGIALNVNYDSVEELYEHCVKNGLGILTRNDFIYPKNGKMYSLNKKEISGVVFLVGQS